MREWSADASNLFVPFVFFVVSSLDEVPTGGYSAMAEASLGPKCCVRGGHYPSK
jgi:hypothetical protein